MGVPGSPADVTTDRGTGVTGQYERVLSRRVAGVMGSAVAATSCALREHPAWATGVRWYDSSR